MKQEKEMIEGVVVDQDSFAKAGRKYREFTKETLEQIEKDYRLGEKPMKRIQAEYGIHYDVLQRMANQFGWVRNMRAQVARHVYDKLHGAEPMMRITHSKEEAAIEIAAVSAVTMIQQHMETTHKVFQLTGIAAQQLEDAMNNRGAIEELIHDETSEADEEESKSQRKAERRREAMMKAVSLPTHVQTLRDLSIAMRSVVELSRVLMGIHETPPPPPESSNTPTVADERIEQLRERLRLSFQQPQAAG
jgi:hypothetical protein